MKTLTIVLLSTSMALIAGILIGRIPDPVNAQVTQMSVVESPNATDISGYESAVLDSGDVGAYNAIGDICVSRNDLRRMLFSSLVMANKQMYIRAYYDVYSCFLDPIRSGDDWSLDYLDSTDRSFALSYLLKGHTLGDSLTNAALESYVSTRRYNIRKSELRNGYYR